MSKGADEILRALIENASVYSNPAFYVIVLDAVDGTANAFATQRNFLQCHKDTWFLMTGLVPTATAGDGANSIGYERINQPEYIRLFDPAKNGEFELLPQLMQMSLFSESNLAHSFTLPEYILWEPGSLIGLEWQGVNWNTGVPNYKFLTLVGIEYRLKG